VSRGLRPLLAGGVGIAGAILVALVVDGSTFDFGLDWLTARALLLGIDPHQLLSDLGERFGVGIDGGGHWIHPRTPAALLIQAPVGFIPWEWVYLAGRLLTVGSFVGMAWVVARLARIPLHWCLIAMPILLLVSPFSDVLAVSQTSFLVAGAIGLTWLMSRDSDRISAGFPLAVAISMKLWPWLLVPALWWTGRRKAAFGCVVGFGALNLAGLALPHVTLSGVVAGLVGADDLGSPTLTGGIPIWILALVAIALVYGLRRWDDWLVYSAAIVAGLVASPVLWSHYLVALAIPVALFVGAKREGRWASGRLMDGVDEASPSRLRLTRS
jgi:hypothetical protein